ncbi:MAG: patatin-like phospholipase family protein [Sphingomonas paucimobilis]
MSASSDSPRLALALQGGGAHGAYGWGVLDRLLEEDLPIVAVSGASAGALNGAALVTGLAAGGRQGAKDALARLWECVSRNSPLQAFDSDFWMMPAFEPFFPPVAGVRQAGRSLFRAAVAGPARHADVAPGRR